MGAQGPCSTKAAAVAKSTILVTDDQPDRVGRIAFHIGDAVVDSHRRRTKVGWADVDRDSFNRHYLLREAARSHHRLSNIE
jgi:hypothetical protein